MSAPDLHLWHPFTQEGADPAPLRIRRGEGVFLETQDGRQILDAISSWWVNLHGHSHPAIAAAIAGQAARLEHVLFAGDSLEPAVARYELLGRLVRKTREENVLQTRGLPGNGGGNGRM